MLIECYKNKMSEDVDQCILSKERKLLECAKIGNYDKLNRVLSQNIDPNSIPESELICQGYEISFHFFNFSGICMV